MRRDDILIDRLLQAADTYPDRPILIGAPGDTTYAEFWGKAQRMAAAVARLDPDGTLGGVMSARGANAYLGIAAALAAGKGYVPLNHKLPDDRLKHIISVSGLSVVLAEEKLAGRLRALVADAGYSVHVVMIDGEGASEWKAERQARVRPASGSAPAYLLFTSGSTGVPKGVAVSNGNVTAYLDAMRRRYAFGPEDRHSQTFELTFDLSVHDMMCPWTTGGALVPVLGVDLLRPASVVRKHAITSWFSVPSLGSLMLRSRTLGEGALPSLKTTLFCGEALPASLADAWLGAARNSVVDNLYGPTEATIAFTGFRWGPARDEGAALYDLVPIGRPFEGQHVALLDDDGRMLDGACRGELLLGGSQVTGSYWKNPEQTEARYLPPTDPSIGPWYRTGDLVERDASGCLAFVGRLDNQIKFRGYRIELGEIEAVARKAAGTEFAVAIPWPVVEGEIGGLALVLAGTDRSEPQIRAELKSKLPEYMMPQAIRIWAELPTNLSGKVDRKAIAANLGTGAASGPGS